MNAARPRAYLVDDEELALRRLARLLNEADRVEIAGRTTDPREALDFLQEHSVDVLFLDISMPEMTGFDLLRRLPAGRQPLVIFTTAYNQHALEAFEVNSIDYLLKPIEPALLDRALNKLDRLRAAHPASRPPGELDALLEKLARALPAAPPPNPPEFPDRLPSRLGDRVLFVELRSVSHIFAREKFTFAATRDGKEHLLDSTIADLENKLDPKRFLRIHRSTMINIDYVHELYTWFAGRMLVRLKDEKKTELAVARDRVKALKERLGL